MAYSKEFKTEKLAEYRRLVDESEMNVLDAAAQVGLPYFTLRRWALAEKGLKHASQVRAEAKARGDKGGGIVVTLRNGCRIEGARVEDVIAILKVSGGRR